MSDRKLKQWLDAGLIDADIVQRITAYEADRSKPLGLWALTGMGALAIGLGLISVVAANWDEVPGMIRLSLHLAIFIGLAGWFGWRNITGKLVREWFHDAVIFILAALGLTFFGHVGQVYQTSSPLWQPLALWLVLFSPLMLIFGRGWLAALLWFSGFMGTVFAHLTWYSDSFAADYYWALISSLPLWVVAFSAWMRNASVRDDFWRRLQQLALVFFVTGFSFLIIMDGLSRSYRGDSLSETMNVVGVQDVLWCLAALVAYLADRGPSGKSITYVIIAAAIINLLSAMIGGTSAFLSAVLFMLFWAVIAVISLQSAWRAIFQISIAILALRLIILSFELATDLLGSGLGLILAGLITLAIAWVAVRISRRYAPENEAELLS